MKQTPHGEVVQALIQNLLVLNEMRLRVAYGSIYKGKEQQELGSDQVSDELGQYYEHDGR